jgi:hypothetical protein
MLHVNHSMGVRKHRQAGHHTRRGSAVAVAAMNAASADRKLASERRREPTFSSVAELFSANRRR